MTPLYTCIFSCVAVTKMCPAHFLKRWHRNISNDYMFKTLSYRLKFIVFSKYALFDESWNTPNYYGMYNIFDQIHFFLKSIYLQHSWKGISVLFLETNFSLDQNFCWHNDISKPQGKKKVTKNHKTFF